MNLNKEDSLNLAVDIGGSKTIIALAYQNKIIATKQIPTSSNGFDDFLRDFYLAFTNLCSESSVNPKSIVSAVIASPGLLDIKNGIVIRAINLDWNSVSLIESFRNLLGIEDIVLESDKSCAALAEYSARKGKHKNKRSGRPAHLFVHRIPGSPKKRKREINVPRTREINVPKKADVTNFLLTSDIVTYFFPYFFAPLHGKKKTFLSLIKDPRPYGLNWSKSNLE